MRQPIQIGYFNQSVFTVCVRYVCTVIWSSDEMEGVR
jgi:hypothetical protein